jgi:hypothetical protein
MRQGRICVGAHDLDSFRSLGLFSAGAEPRGRVRPADRVEILSCIRLEVPGTAHSTRHPPGEVGRGLSLRAPAQRRSHPVSVRAMCDPAKLDGGLICIEAQTTGKQQSFPDWDVE